jgi:hypothetical protein
MDVPERIYVKINHPISSEYTEIIAFEEGDGIEYCRTDAFIEKACEFWKDHLAGYDIYEDDIERSVESFKLAMKL